MDKNSLMYWYPKIKDLDIPQPKTEIVLVTEEEFIATMEAMPNSLTEKVSNKIEEKFSLPVFIRTDLSSGKHSWKDSCYFDGKFNHLWRHLFEICEFNHCAGLLGLHFESMVIREYIPMESKFTAFWGNMPVNPERRYFIKDGNILCRHHYWIEEAIINNDINPLPHNWKDILKEINTQTEEEIKLLSGYAEEIAKNFEGYWSVDFCKAKDGRWILIDMALGNSSWHPKDCPKNTKEV